jgi:hypothetical protein
MSFQFDILFNQLGILLEIAGFVIILKAIISVSRGQITHIDPLGSGWENEPYLMSNRHPEEIRLVFG